MALPVSFLSGTKAHGRVMADSLESRMAASLQPFIEAGELSGAVALTGTSAGVEAVISLGKANLEQGTEMTPQTRFRIASMTKPLTATAVMILAEEGKLKPTDQLENYLPAFKGVKVAVKTASGKTDLQDPKNPLLIERLLTHTSGLPAFPKSLGEVYGARKPDIKTCVEAIAKLPLDFDPGAKWAYCNPGIDTLGRLVEVVSGQAFADFVAERIFKPLHMQTTRFFPTPEDRGNSAAIYERKEGKLAEVAGGWNKPPLDAVNPIPAGGLWSTGPDMAKVCVHFLGLVRGSLPKGILDSRTAKEMTRVHTGELAAGFTEGMGFGYGFGVVRKPSGVTAKLSPGTFGHGGAFGTQYWMDPVKDRFVVLMIQRQGLANGDASPMRKALQEVVFA